MKLKSFGCSLIFGSDLHDDGRSGLMATPSRHTYPALISQALGLDYSCQARPGAGNFEILCRLLDEIATGEPAIYVINWTWIDRFSYVNRDMSTGHHPYNPWGWQSVLPTDQDDLAEIYYRDLHSQLRDKLQTLSAVKSALDALKYTGNEFVMTWTDYLMWETEWHCTPGVRWMQQQVRPYFSDFEGTSFLEWCRKHQFEISAASHPLEPAHRAAADFVLASWTDWTRR